MAGPLLEGCQIGRKEGSKAACHNVTAAFMPNRGKSCRGEQVRLQKLCRSILAKRPDAIDPSGSQGVSGV
jgi:hypothetical protein